MGKPFEVTHGPRHAVGRAGAFADMLEHTVELVPGKDVRGKLFLGDALGLTGMEVSLNSLPPGREVPFLHVHEENEELYVFLGGTGQMVIDGAVIEVAEGTAVRIATGAARSWRNTGTVPLHYIVIQAREGTLRQKNAADSVVPPDRPKYA